MGRLGSKTERSNGKLTRVNPLMQVNEAGGVEAVNAPDAGASEGGGDIEGVLIGEAPLRSSIDGSVEPSSPFGETSSSSSMSYEAWYRKAGALRSSFEVCPCTLTLGVWVYVLSWRAASSGDWSRSSQNLL